MARSKDSFNHNVSGMCMCFRPLTFPNKDIPMEEIMLPILVTDKLKKGSTFEMQKWPIIDVHAIMAFLFNKAGISIPAGEVENYWQMARRNREPWAIRSGASDKHMPLGIYGDSATIVMKYGFKESVCGIFVNLPLFRPASVRMSRFLVAAVPEDNLWHHHTINHILRRVVWSCNCLYRNLHPSHGPAGEQLPPRMQALAGLPITQCGTAFTVTEIRGDWAWHRKTFRFQGWTSHNMCYQCEAKAIGSTADRYYSFHDGNWIDREYSAVQFIAKQLPPDGVCAPAQLVAQFCAQSMISRMFFFQFSS